MEGAREADKAGKGEAGKRGMDLKKSKTARQMTMKDRGRRRQADPVKDQGTAREIEGRMERRQHERKLV